MSVLSSFLVLILYFTFGDQTLAVEQLSEKSVGILQLFQSKPSFSGLNPKKDGYYKMKPHEVIFLNKK